MLQFIGFASIFSWLDLAHPLLLAVAGTLLVGFASIQGGRDRLAMSRRAGALREARRRDRNRGDVGFLMLAAIGAVMGMAMMMGRKSA